MEDITTCINPTVIRQVVQELQSLERQPLEGIKISINEENIADIQAWIIGPEQTPFEGGYFKVKLQLGSDFPTAPPKGYFVTKVFHPNVSKTGEICVNTLKKDWKKELGLSHILLTIKCLLIAPNPESALNEDAGRLLLEDYDAYAQHAKLWTSIHATRPSNFEFSSDYQTASLVDVGQTCVASAAEQPLSQSSEMSSHSYPSQPHSLDNSPKKRSAKEEKSSKKRSLKRL